jgi:hypothetical protein
MTVALVGFGYRPSARLPVWSGDIAEYGINGCYFLSIGYVCILTMTVGFIIIYGGELRLLIKY